MPDMQTVTKPKKRPKRTYIKSRVVFGVDGSFVIHIGIRTKSPNGGRTHFGEIKRQRVAVAKLLANVAPPILARTVAFTRWAPGNGLDKDDNLNVAMKHVRDQVVAWLQGKTTGDIEKDRLAKGDDSPGCGLEFSYVQHRLADWGVTVRIV